MIVDAAGKITPLEVTANQDLFMFFEKYKEVYTYRQYSYVVYRENIIPLVFEDLCTEIAVHHYNRHYRG